MLKNWERKVAEMVIDGMCIEKMEKEALEKVIADIRQELENREVANCLYTNECKASSKYHREKYKHWAKLITGVDTTKTNEYAFLGKFLGIAEEHLLPKNSIVVEYCEAHGVTAYRITDDNVKEEIGSARPKEMTALIRQLATELHAV